MRQAISECTISTAIGISKLAGKHSCETECRKMLLRGLSRMRREAHVRFLGGGGAAMRCRYPTIRPSNRHSQQYRLHPTHSFPCQKNFQQVIQESLPKLGRCNALMIPDQ